MQLTVYKVTMSGLAVFCLFLILLCLQENVQAKNIQHKQSPLGSLSRNHQESSERTGALDTGGHKHGDSHRQSPAFRDNEDSNDDDSVSWVDEDDDLEDDDYMCDDENDFNYNPFCQFYDYQGPGEGMRNGNRVGVSKRRLRFNKRRLRFIKKRHPEQFGTTSKMSVDNLYPRDLRAPRLRFAKRDLNKREVHQSKAEQTIATNHAESPSRKRRSISDLSRDLSLDKRLSINQDIKLLADMVIAHAQRRIREERADLRARLLKQGKRSEPTLQISDMSDAVLSQAFTDVLKSMLTTSR